MLQVSAQTHLGRNQHHIFLHHLDEDGTYYIKWFEGDVAQRSLKWLRTILALVMMSFPIVKYQDACYKVTVTPILIIQPSFWFPLTRNFFSIFCNWNCFFRQQYDHTVKIIAMISYVNWILWDEVIFNSIAICRCLKCSFSLSGSFGFCQTFDWSLTAYKGLGQTNLIFRFAGETWKKVGAGGPNKNKNIVNFYKF